jgi:hypothetical protein
MDVTLCRLPEENACIQEFLVPLTEGKAYLLQLLGKCLFPSIAKPNHIDTNRFDS